MAAKRFFVVRVDRRKAKTFAAPSVSQALRAAHPPEGAYVEIFEVLADSAEQAMKGKLSEPVAGFAMAPAKKRNPRKRKNGTKFPKSTRAVMSPGYRKGDCDIGERVRVLSHDSSGKPIGGDWTVVGVFAKHYFVCDQHGTVLRVPKKGVARKNPTENVERSIAEYERFHWGDSPDEVAEVERPAAQGNLVAVGELEAVTYKTHKDGETAVWEHRFEGKRPVLSYDESDDLHIVRGPSKYKIESRGIVG